MGGCSIGRVIEVKSLGVGLDPCSRFHLHIREVVKMLSKTVPIIYRIKSTLNALCLKILHYAIIYPNIFYCASSWVGTYKSTMSPVSWSHAENLIRWFVSGIRYNGTKRNFEVSYSNLCFLDH